MIRKITSYLKNSIFFRACLGAVILAVVVLAPMFVGLILLTVVFAVLIGLFIKSLSEDVDCG